ncbi:MAG: porin [Methylibium sp. NZG]|nr:MAG: porin [Methylibium sp. NZG]
MMKKSLLTVALATVAAGSALAQSSVTIYGRLNQSVERQKTGTAEPVWVLQNSSSRIGFKGAEDLGGGLKAGFQIEHGFSPDTGAAAGTFWGRQSEVNLGGNFGLLRLGNFTSEAYFATADYISMHNHDTGTSSDALYAYLGRDINKIAYRTPDIKGLTVEGAVALSEASGFGRTIDLAANYAIGPLQLGAGYQRVSTTAQKQFAIRGLYEIGSFVIGAYVQRDENGYAAGKRTTTRLSGMYTLGSSELHLNFGNAGKYSSVPDSSAKQFTVGYNYNMSKRTKVYSFYTKVDAAAGNTYLTDFSSFAVGVRHNF